MEHYMIIQFNKDCDAKEMYESIKELFSGASQIEGVRKAEVFLSSAPLRQRYDMMIKVRMNKGSLASFENSELYRKWKEDYADRIRKLTVFDS